MTRIHNPILTVLTATLAVILLSTSLLVYRASSATAAKETSPLLPIATRAQLEHRTWYLASDPQAHIKFENGNVDGEDGCNIFGGPYTITQTPTGLVVSFGAIFTTMRYCEDTLVTQHAFSTIFRRTNSITITSALGKPTLLAFYPENTSPVGNPDAVVFSDSSLPIETPFSTTMDIQNITWFLIDKGGASLHLEDGTAHGNDSCNLFNGKYTLTNDEHGTLLSFGVIGMTRQACLGTQRVEGKFRNMFNKTNHYVVVSLPDGSQRLTIFPADATPEDAQYTLVFTSTAPPADDTPSQ